MAKTIGRYEIREELGRGGMASVYLAYDSRLDREVALKLMDQQLSEDPTFATRFEREAKTVAGLSHNAIVSLFDFGEADGWLYLVMPYMKGGTLKQQIANGPLTTKRAYNVVRRIGSALDKAHSQHIIHRDLKPANILLDDEQEPYLSDFGIVKVAQGDKEYLTETGQTIGTYAYMSPEQIMGRPIDGRSDIYALGIVLYEMITAHHPYSEATTTGAMAVAHAQQPVPDITLGNPALPTALNDVIGKAMAKDPADRYGSGREMALALYDALTGKLTATTAGAATAASGEKPSQTPVEPQTSEATAPPALAEQPAARQKSKTPIWLLAIIGVVALACIGIFSLFYLAALGSEGGDESTTTPNLTSLVEETATSVVQTPTPVVEIEQVITPIVLDSTPIVDESSSKVLWIDDCDPRTDAELCREVSSLETLEAFYRVFESLGSELEYAIPASSDELNEYDVVIANFCGAAATTPILDLLETYISSGGSVVVMGDEFCVGVGPINGEFVSSGQAATMLTKGRGIAFGSEEIFDRGPFTPNVKHPLTEGVEKIYDDRQVNLLVSSPAEAIFTQDEITFVGLYDDEGTIVTIPTVGFQWDSRLPPDNDNFALWTNMLGWLIEQSRTKMTR